MAFVKNAKLQEIRSASRSGNEKAAMVLQALRNGSSQEDLDRLVEDYYGINATDAVENVAPVQIDNPEETRPIIENTDLNGEVMDEPIHDEPYQKDLMEDEDFDKRLDDDLKDVITENKLDDVDFNKFLKDKENNSLKSQRTSDYFKAYDPIKREGYLANKIQKYSDSFGGKRRNAERKFNDMSKSLELYNQNVNDMLDDSIELDISQMNNAYSDFVNNEDTMSSFGRYWDEQDSENIKNVLAELVQRYGKKNIQAMLNTLTSDATSYKDFLDNQVETEVGRYTKDIEKLLK
jgi:hypothetical protein